VQFYSRHFNADAQLPLAESVAHANRQWTFTSGSLAVGTYILTATVTVPGGYPSGPLTLTNQIWTPVKSDLVYIDLTPRLVRWLSRGKKADLHPSRVRGHGTSMPRAARPRHHHA
jgi:hypothetical protein